MAKKRIKVGIIGLGVIGSVHADAYAVNAGEAKLAAVCDVLPERVASVCGGAAGDFPAREIYLIEYRVALSNAFQSCSGVSAASSASRFGCLMKVSVSPESSLM